MLKKYEFTGETKEEFGVKLNRIRLLIDLPGFQKGDFGGWIEKESNLSHEGNCWVFGNGQIFGDGKVYDNALIWDDGKVFGNGNVFGRSKVWDHGKVFDNGFVSGNSKVFGNARVRHKFTEGTCVNITIDPWIISYSGYEDSYGEKEHYVSVGCHDHKIEDWLNASFHQKFISRNIISEKKCQEYLRYLNCISINVLDS